jgi:anti-sigma factor ChrR (cupin superfamily)
VLSCRDVTASASRLFDGELGLSERIAVRVHLIVCVHCRRFVRQLRVLLASLHRRQEIAPALAPAYLERIVAALDRARPDLPAPQGMDGR